MFFPLQPKLRFSRQVNGTKDEYQRSAGIYNGMVEIGQRPYTTSRPSFVLEADASGVGAGAKGRGVYWWVSQSALYIANDNEVYSGSYIALGGDNPASGDQRMYFAEVGDDLCMIDPEGNDGYTVSDPATTTLNRITDADFPANAGLQLAKGAVGFKGRIYVMDTQGSIWNSDLEDATSWNALNSINAEIEPDKGVCIAKLQGEIVAFGTKTIEYFYYAANPTGSPLSARQDVFHDVGMADFDSLAYGENTLYFVGQDRTGGRGVYALSNHQLKKISTPDFDTFLSIPDLAQSSPEQLWGAAVNLHGREFYFLTLWVRDATYSQTYVYDTLTDYWYEWKYVELSGYTGFELVGWIENRAAALSDRSYGLLGNGDLIYYKSNIYQSDGGAAEGDSPVGFEILTGNQRFDSNRIKFMTNVSMDCFVSHAETEETSQTAQLRFYDEGEINSAGLPTHDIELLDRRVSTAGASNTLARAGGFYQRNFEVTLPTEATTTKIEAYGLMFDIREGI